MTSDGVTDSGLRSLLRPPRLRCLGVSPCDPAGNLRGGIEFGAALYRAWAAAGEQRDLTFGSYNAGLGNVQKAVALAGAASWGAAAALLVRLTGRHAAETTVYVRGIKRTYLGLR